MSLFVVGLNHKTTPVELREKAYFSPDKLGAYLQDITSSGVAEEVVLLSTCNRSELYCETTQIEKVRQWFLRHTQIPETVLARCLYVHQDEAAVKHIMSVACGLDSMILGEPQILGQMKEAFSESCAASAVGALFHRLFQTVFSVAKEIRTSTAIGACPVSVASAAVHFAKNKFPDLMNASLVFLGASDTTQLLLRYLSKELKKPITLISRQPERAKEILGDLPGVVLDYDALPKALLTADVVFSATGSPTPLVTEAMLKSIMLQRQHLPLMFIDIAMPRDIDPTVAALPAVSVFCIDDLKNIIAHNRKGREHAAVKALEMIETKSAAFIAEIESIDKVAHTIRAYRTQIERLCRFELQKAKHQLEQGEDPLHVLETFSQAYTNKLLHAPSVSLRQAGAEGRFELLRLVKQLLAIHDHEPERL